MGLIPLDHKVIIDKLLNVLDPLPLPPQLREPPGLPLELLLQCLHVVAVDMRVAELNDEFVCLGARDVRDHVRQEGVGRNVERDTEAEVGGSLEHETGELGFGLGIGIGGRVRGWKVHVELAHHMTRGERHLWDIWRRNAQHTIEVGRRTTHRHTPLGFHALKMILRSVGSSLIFLIHSRS